MRRHNDYYNYSYCGSYGSVRPIFTGRECVEDNFDLSHLLFGGFGSAVAKLFGIKEKEGGEKQNADC